MTVIPFPSGAIPGAIPAPATGREPHTPVDSFAARPSCTVCNGEGVVWYDRAPDPRLAWGEFECSRCDGDGHEPEGPCGPGCYCWQPLESDPDGREVRGLCVKDEEPELIRANVDYSAWREWLR